MDRKCHTKNESHPTIETIGLTEQQAIEKTVNWERNRRRNQNGNEVAANTKWEGEHWSWGTLGAINSRKDDGSIIVTTYVRKRHFALTTLMICQAINTIIEFHHDLMNKKRDLRWVSRVAKFIVNGPDPHHQVDNSNNSFSNFTTTPPLSLGGDTTPTSNKNNGDGVTTKAIETGETLQSPEGMTKHTKLIT